VFCGDQPQNPDKNLAPAGFFVFWSIHKKLLDKRGFCFLASL
jgi:hypothetical protein